ncbi:MAG: hypothetical protein OXT70_01230 [Chloroflexota bacterium]|nr:hypothetical protein [Chloroflexota bacterium]
MTLVIAFAMAITAGAGFASAEGDGGGEAVEATVTIWPTLNKPHSLDVTVSGYDPGMVCTVRYDGQFTTIQDRPVAPTGVTTTYQLGANIETVYPYGPLNSAYAYSDWRKHVGRITATCELPEDTFEFADPAERTHQWCADVDTRANITGPVGAQWHYLPDPNGASAIITRWTPKDGLSTAEQREQDGERRTLPGPRWVHDDDVDNDTIICTS